MIMNKITDRYLLIYSPSFIYVYRRKTTLMAKEKTHYNLNAKQLHILTLLYKFRYATIPLLTSYKNLKSNSLQRTLDILLEKEYIGRKFEPVFKIDRKPAIYYLSTKGIALLKDDPRFDPNVLHSYYKNKSISTAFMQHSIDTLAVFNALKRSYGDTYQIFTKQELSAFDDLPETKPDLYLRGDREYFITLSHDVQPFLIRKRLAEYITHSEEEGWSGGVYPALLFVFADSNNEVRFLDFAKKSLESAGIDTDELSIGATTIKALGDYRTSAIWTYARETSSPVGLI
ncbi:hypothetical protein CL689_01810 [Candidatus Saccharibacteria bacterium]|nr:hypothetical protein [Candidatus Saccharibacteria bacterium]